MTIFRRLRRRPVGRHAHRGVSATVTIVPGGDSPPTATPVVNVPPLVPHAIQRASHPRPVPVAAASPESPSPVTTETVRSATSVPDEPEGTRVGLFFGDGSHVVFDASDPRAGAFASIAEELNR